MVRPVLEERLALIVGPDHRLAGTERVDLADLADEPWILPYRRHGVRALVEAACAEAGFQLRVAVELSGLGPIKLLVQRGSACRSCRRRSSPTRSGLGSSTPLPSTGRPWCARSGWPAAATSTRHLRPVRWSRRSSRSPGRIGAA